MDCFQLVFFSEPLTGHGFIGWHEKKDLFSLLAKQFNAKPTWMGKMMIPLCYFFIWALLFAQSLFPTCFVLCQFKTLHICNFTAHAECICNVLIRSHLEDVAVITNTFAFHSHQLQARSLVSLPHPSTLRRRKIPCILYIYKIWGIL